MSRRARMPRTSLSESSRRRKEEKKDLLSSAVLSSAFQQQFMVDLNMNLSLNARPRRRRPARSSHSHSNNGRNTNANLDWRQHASTYNASSSSSSSNLTLAQKIGIVEKPAPKLTSEEWAGVHAAALEREYHTICCAICQEDYEKPGDQVLLSCTHVFHKMCVRNFEKFSGQKTCPICRKKDYEKRLIHDGFEHFKGRCAVKIQTMARGWIARRRYKVMLLTIPPKDPTKRKTFFINKLERASNRLVEMMDDRDSAIDSLFAEFDNNIANQQASIQAMEQRMTRIDDSEWNEIKHTAHMRHVTECPICMVDFHPSKPVMLLSCSHVFHEQCLASFETFTSQVNQGRAIGCPLCRQTGYKKVPFEVRLDENDTVEKADDGDDDGDGNGGSDDNGGAGGGEGEGVDCAQTGNNTNNGEKDDDDEIADINDIGAAYDALNDLVRGHSDSVSAFDREGEGLHGEYSGADATQKAHGLEYSARAETVGNTRHAEREHHYGYDSYAIGGVSDNGGRGDGGGGDDDAASADTRVLQVISSPGGSNSRNTADGGSHHSDGGERGSQSDSSGDFSTKGEGVGVGKNKNKGARSSRRSRSGHTSDDRDEGRGGGDVGRRRSLGLNVGRNGSLSRSRLNYNKVSMEPGRKERVRRSTSRSKVGGNRGGSSNSVGRYGGRGRARRRSGNHNDSSNGNGSSSSSSSSSNGDSSRETSSAPQGSDSASTRLRRAKKTHMGINPNSGSTSRSSTPSSSSGTRTRTHRTERDVGIGEESTCPTGRRASGLLRKSVLLSGESRQEVVGRARGSKPRFR